MTATLDAEHEVGVLGLAKELFEIFRAQRERAIDLERWTRGKPPRDPALPQQPTKEYEQLQYRSHTPWGGLVVTNIAQALYAEGFRGSDDKDNSPLWAKIWQPNGLDSRQGAIYRGALTHGLSYVKTMQGKDPLTGEVRPIVKGRSAKRMAAWYEDITDEYPEYALEAWQVPKRMEKTTLTEWNVLLYDKTNEYTMKVDDDGAKNWRLIQTRPHGGRGVVPVQRFANSLDLDGVSLGEVEPFVPLFARIDQDTFDRLVVQRFGAWKVRWIAGMAKPKTDEEKRAAGISLRQEDLLVSDKADTKFGTFEATDLSGFIAAREADIRDLAAVTQTPPHYLLGLSDNLSAEALAAAEAALMRKVEERRHSFGETWEQTMRLSAWVAGDREAASDYSSQISWRDIESRSLAQVADALGKLATQLKVPFEMLWDRIPGWTTQDSQRAKQMLQDADADKTLTDFVNAAAAAMEAEAAAKAKAENAPKQDPAQSGGTPPKPVAS